MWENVSENCLKWTLYVEKRRKRAKGIRGGWKWEEGRRQGSKKEYKRKKKAPSKMITVVTSVKGLLWVNTFFQISLNFINFS